MCADKQLESHADKHLDPAVNAERSTSKSGSGRSKEAPRASASLVLYHKYAAPESASESESEADEDGAEGRRSTALKHQIKGALPEHADGKIILRAECARPCWATESKRYEAPIRIGMGKTGVSACERTSGFSAADGSMPSGRATCGMSCPRRRRTSARARVSGPSSRWPRAARRA